MYVCICNALRQSQIIAAAHNGAATVEAAYAANDAQVQCGQCRDEAHELICAARQNLMPHNLMQAAAQQPMMQAAE